MRIAEYLNMDSERLVAALEELVGLVGSEREKSHAMMEAAAATPDDRLHELTPVARIPIEAFYRQLFGASMQYLQTPDALPPWLPNEPTNLNPFVKMVVSVLHTALMQTFRLGVGYGRRVPTSIAGEQAAETRAVEECPHCFALWRWSDIETREVEQRPHYPDCVCRPDVKPKGATE